MKPIQTALSLTLAFGALTTAGSARADLQPMPDEELRQSQGAMGVPGLAAARFPFPASSILPLPGGGWSLDITGGRLLTAAQLQATMAEAGIVGLGAAPASGQPVFEFALTVKSGNYTMPASQVFAPLGLMPNLPDLGTLRLLDVNTSGSRFWVWPH